LKAELIEKYRYNPSDYPCLEDDIINYYKLSEIYENNSTVENKWKLHTAWEMLYYSIKHCAVAGIINNTKRDELWRYFGKSGVTEDFYSG